MRWVKHMTATRRDEKIADLISRYGMAGYGTWWAVVEVVAERVEKNSHPSVTYPVTTWSHLLSLRGSHVRQGIEKLVVTHLVTATWEGDDLTVTIPNLLKYRDEFSRKSGVTPDTVRSKRQKQIQRQNTEAETDAPAVEPEQPVVEKPPAELVQDLMQDSYAAGFTAAIGRLGFGNPDGNTETAYFTARVAEVCESAGASPELGAFVAADLIKSPRFRGKPLEYLLGALRSELAPKGPNKNSLKRAGAA